MLKKGDVVGYVRGEGFRSVVLEEVLKMLEGRGFEVVSLPPPLKFSSVHSRLISKKLINAKKFRDNYVSTENRAGRRFGVINCEAKPRQIKITKIAVPVTADLTAYKIVNEIVSGNIDNLKKKDKKIITPLFLFLDKEVLLYAELRKLKFGKIKKLRSLQTSRLRTGYRLGYYSLPQNRSHSRLIVPQWTSSHCSTKKIINEKTFLDNFVSVKKSGEADFVASNNRAKRGKIDLNKVSKFIDELEKKHPEIKQAVVKGLLGMFPPAHPR